MRLIKCILTANDCYKAGRTITPKGVMVHSTGANNPAVARYVQPVDTQADAASLYTVLGTNRNKNDWNNPGLDVCVHAFVGKLADGGVGSVQTLPWNHRGWHAGTGTSGGSANNTHIAFEICEDGLADAAYFGKVYQEAVELTAMLCKQYNLNPLADGVVICHSEGYQRGVASNHADVMHWFPKHGKSMDTFRADVAALLKGEEEDTMEQSTFDAMLTAALARRAAALEAQPVSGWAKEAWEAAVAAGVFDGTKPQAPLTREQAAAVLARLGKLK